MSVQPVHSPSGTPARKSGAAARNGGTRERILAVAEELISRHGMEGLRLKDVAQRVGIQPPSVFAHFKGRKAIGDAIAQRVLEQLAAVVEEAVAAGGAPDRVLARGVRAVAAHLFDHPAHARMLLRDLARVHGGGELELTSPATGRMVEVVGALLEAGADSGCFRAIPATAFVQQVEGAILATVGWAGFDEEGRPVSSVTRDALLDQAEDLALALARA